MAQQQARQEDEGQTAPPLEIIAVGEQMSAERDGEQSVARGVELGGERDGKLGAERDGERLSAAGADGRLPDELDDDALDDDFVADGESGQLGQAGEMFEHFAVTADRGQSMIRIDKFLTCRIENASRVRIQQAADNGSVLVNGVAVKSSYKVKPLDRISIVMPYPRREVEIIPEQIPLEIVHEDDDLLLVDKAAGMVVHPGHGNYSGTLVNALAWHLREHPPFEGSDMRAGLVHRIDKNTSGLLVVAKNARAHNFLAKQFFDHTISRRYVALVWGSFDHDQGRIEGNIGRSVRDRLRMAVYADGREGKAAVTHYRVLRRYGYVTLIECRLETGRTHQIRVHMEHIGHPLFNDERYGGDRILKGTTFSKYRQFVENCFALMPRHALHARSLGFVHPTTREEVSFESELPDDFRALLERWESYGATHPGTEEG
ncbi:pseudouridine synthase [Bacteroidia bacterium]|nr:pseudouridine synthase [Bacteroidia bacterium]